MEKKKKKLRLRVLPNLGITANKMALTVAELAEQLSISKAKAHELVRRDGFPVIEISGKKIVPIVALNDWLKAVTPCPNKEAVRTVRPIKKQKTM